MELERLANSSDKLHNVAKEVCKKAFLNTETGIFHSEQYVVQTTELCDVIPRRPVRTRGTMKWTNRTYLYKKKLQNRICYSIS